MGWLIRWVMSAAFLYGTIHGLNLFNSEWARWTWREWWGAPAAVVVMSIVNVTLRPLLRLLTLPISCLTFGLFSLAVNAIMFWLVGELTGAFTVNWIGAGLGALVMGVFGAITRNAFKPGQEDD